jgi:hypothetical protein
MQQWNQSPIDTGRWPMHRVGEIGVRKDWWDIAQAGFFCKIHGEDPYPVDVDRLSEERYKEVHEILSIAIKKFVISIAVIHPESISIFQALFSRTVNPACELPISWPRCLR